VSGSDPSGPPEPRARERGSAGLWRWAESRSHGELPCKRFASRYKALKKALYLRHTEGISQMV